MAIKETIRKVAPGAIGSYHLSLAWLAERRHRNPSGRLFVIGITGTKGKTTTLELLNAILESAGKSTALLSSLRAKVGSESAKNRTGNSMPGRGYIQNFLARAANAKCAYALVEVTSQGVVAHRHRFINWNIAAITNLSPEHIESHGSFENYRGAKLSFLRYVGQRGGKVFLNRDDEHYPFFAEQLALWKPIEYSRLDGSLENYLPSDSPVRSATGDEIPHFVMSDFNKENIACAVAIAKEIGIGDQAIQNALMKFDGVPGRMNFVKAGDFVGVVDYAHTPDSLAAAYRAVREYMIARGPHMVISDADVAEMTHGRLICVLGAAGGGRDVWKRPEFGRIAAKLCDEIVLTEEDPYDEKPNEIVASIRKGIIAAGYPEARIHEIPDRREALRVAASFMQPGDVLIGTGKGSEEWIHRARGEKTPWNEKEEIEKALAERNSEGIS